MLELLGIIIQGAMAHSECVALFTILLIQQIAMHIVNMRKIDSLPRKINRRRGDPRQPEDEDDAQGR